MHVRKMHVRKGDLRRPAGVPQRQPRPRPDGAGAGANAAHAKPRDAAAAGGCERSVKIKLKIKKTYFENKSNTILKIKDLAAKIK